MAEGLYVYCIVEEDLAPEELATLAAIKLPAGLGQVHALQSGGLLAVVSASSEMVLVPARANVLAHEHVIARIMEQHTVIPLSFGNIFRSEADFRLLLERLAPELRKIFPGLAQKIELGLKVFWQTEAFARELQEFSAALPKRRKTGDYESRLQLGQAAARKLEERAGQLGEEVVAKLRPLAASSRVNPNVGESMVLNAAFLVEKKQEEAFDHAVEKLAGQYQDLLRFQYTGPWPSYNFINIKIGVKEG